MANSNLQRTVRAKKKQVKAVQIAFQASGWTLKKLKAESGVDYQSRCRSKCGQKTCRVPRDHMGSRGGG